MERIAKMNLIEKLKQNKKPFMYLQPDEQDYFRTVIGKKGCNILLESGIYDSCDEGNDEHFHRGNVYQIKADYSPEPKIEKCEVNINSIGHFFFMWHGTAKGLYEAFSIPDYLYPLDEDGNIMPELRPHKNGITTYPKYVVFKVK